MSGTVICMGIEWDFDAVWVKKTHATQFSPSEGGIYEDIYIYLQGEPMNKWLTHSAIDKIEQAIQDLGEPEDTE